MIAAAGNLPSVTGVMSMDNARPRGPRSWLLRSLVAGPMVGVVVAGGLAWAGTAQRPAASTSDRTLWPDDPVPAVAAFDDTQPVEVGTRFTASAAGRVVGVRFYKGPGNGGTHVGHLWTATGRQLAEVTFTGETGSGWQTASFATPVDVAPGTGYVVSYHAPAGRYAADAGYFRTAHRSGPLTAPVNAGVFSYGARSTFPVHAFGATNYWVDVTASIDDDTGPPPPTPTPTPSTPPPAGFPGATNTGYANAPGYPGSLTPFTGTVTSGQTYRFLRFPPGFEVGAVSDVTFYGCRFDGDDAQAFANVVVAGGDNITFDYSSFVPRVLTAPPVGHTQSSQFGLWQHPTDRGRITVDHSDFWGFGNGIQFFPTGRADKPFTVRNSWFHDARADGGEDHTDAILDGDDEGGHIVIEHNTIVSRGNTNGLALQEHTLHDVTVTGNYFSGFGYTVAVGVGTRRNIRFTGNTFGTDLRPDWGPLYGWSDGDGNLWRENRWHVAPGGYSDNTSDDGKFWTPDGISSTDWNR
jgi:hypothetical protein